jgi:hypothetical protein
MKRSLIHERFDIHTAVNIHTVVVCIITQCETWSLTLREEHRPRVFENRALRRIFGPKRDEVIGD